MKKALLPIACSLLCSCMGPFVWDKSVERDSPHLSLQKAWSISSALVYIHEDGNHWKTPAETALDGGGDCEDIAVYMMYLIGEEAGLVIVNTPKGTKHCLLTYRGSVLEPQVYGKYVTEELDIVESVPYYFALIRAGWGDSDMID